MSILVDLRDIDLFQEMEERDLERIAKSVVSRFYRKGDLIIREGEVGVGFYIVRKGGVEVIKDLGGPNEMQLSGLTAGGHFGELGLLVDEVREVSMRATEDTECLVLTKWDFMAELQARDSTIAVALLPAMARLVLHYVAEAHPHSQGATPDKSSSEDFGPEEVRPSAERKLDLSGRSPARR